MNDQLVVMNEINRLIKDLEVLSCRQLFNMALSDILDIVLRDNIQNVVDEIKNPMKARLLLVEKDLEQISKVWERMNNEKDKKIEKLKELVLKQTKTAAKLDPLRKEKYWRRLYDAGFYDDYPARIIKYGQEVHRLLKQQNTAD